MVLSDIEITGALDSGRLVIDPLDRDRIQPASVDLLLSPEFAQIVGHRTELLDTRRGGAGHMAMIDTGGAVFVLHPGEFVLASTVEHVTLPDDLAGQVDGKSTWGRLGVAVHSTAGWIDPGFSGRITLELSCVGPVPVQLHPGDPACQLVLFRMGQRAARPYGTPGLGSRYQGQDGVTPARPGPTGKPA